MPALADSFGRVVDDERKTVEGFAAIGVRTVSDRSETESATSAGVDASGEIAVRLPFDFQLRGGGDATFGGGPSAVPSGGASVAASTPRGLFTTELEQRVGVRRLPSLFAGRARAPGQRYDEVVTTLRTSAATGPTKYGADGIFLPVTVQRTRTYADDDLTRWNLRVGLFTSRSATATVDLLDFRSEWAGGASLHHLELLDARLDVPTGRGRLRLGAAEDDPVAASDSAAGLAYRTWEGELAVGGRDRVVGYDLGFRSDCMLTSDGKLAREHHLHGGGEYAVLGGWLGLGGFLARTHVGETDQPAMPVASAWTYGARATYTRRLDAFDVSAVAAAGRTFHRRVGDHAIAPLAPGFAATLSLAITASTGARPERNRMPDSW